MPMVRSGPKAAAAGAPVTSAKRHQIFSVKLRAHSTKLCVRLIAYLPTAPHGFIQREALPGHRPICVLCG